MAIGCLIASLGAANAALLTYEGFDYSAGGLNGQNSSDPFYSAGWATHAGNVNVNVVANGLTWAGLATSGGSAVTASDGSNNGRGSRVIAPASAWGATTVGTFYMSFLAGFGTGTPVNHRVIEMWNAAGQGDGARSLQVGYSDFTGLGQTLSFNVNNGNGGLTETDVAEGINIATDNGATHLFVFRFDLTADPLGDLVTAYLDPTDLVNEPGTPSGILFGFDFGLAALGCGTEFIFPGTPPTTDLHFDELRIGTAYTDVLPVPEPATVTLLGLGAFGVVMAARRKRA